MEHTEWKKSIGLQYMSITIVTYNLVVHLQCALAQWRNRNMNITLGFFFGGSTCHLYMHSNFDCAHTVLMALDVASNGFKCSFPLCCKLQNIFKILIKFLCVVIVCILNALQGKQGVCHTVAFPFTLKNLLIKEELWKFKYFTMQKYSLKKTLLKKPKSFKISY
jgi:hypothetical protein